jgi:hypothetical protein
MAKLSGLGQLHQQRIKLSLQLKFSLLGKQKKQDFDFVPKTLAKSAG